MVIEHVISHGLFFAFIVNTYLFLFMITTSPRVWGYSDYPEVVKNKVPPPTKKEKTLAGVVGLPWIVFVLVYPIYSTYGLKTKLDGEITFLTAFLNIFVLSMLAFLVDLVILDWLIISKITPKFVIIPGTDVEDYKDFSHHYKAHARAVLVLVPVCLILAGIVWLF